jgi:hypothetical protein
MSLGLNKETAKEGTKTAFAFDYMFPAEYPSSLTVGECMEACRGPFGIDQELPLILTYRGEEIEFWRNPNELLSEFLKKHGENINFVISYLHPEESYRADFDKYTQILTRAREEFASLIAAIQAAPEFGPQRPDTIKALLEKDIEIKRCLGVLDPCKKCIEKIQKRLSFRQPAALVFGGPAAEEGERSGAAPLR